MGKTWALPTWKTPPAFPTSPQLGLRGKFIHSHERIYGGRSPPSDPDGRVVSRAGGH